MVIQFGFSNYSCYFKPTIIQFSTNAKTQKYKSDTFGQTFNALKYLPVFGSNASGKSALINAVSFFSKFVRNNTVIDEFSNSYCRTKKENADVPSTFEIVLDINGRFYQYGFSLLLSKRVIIDEYLNEITPSTKAVTELFGRSNRSVNISNLGKKVKEDLNFRIEDSIVRNRLFLTNIGSLLETNPNNVLEIFYKVYEYITSHIIIIDKKTQSQYVFVADKVDDGFIEKLRMFDFNIRSIEKKPVDWDTISIAIDSYYKNLIISSLTSKKNDHYSLILDNKLFTFKLVDNKIVAEKICFKHCNSDSDFEYTEESDGTIRIMDFLPLFFIDDECTFFIDEIEQSISSDVVIKFFEQLREEKNNVQVLFTTHLDRLFDIRHFRKDEIYIVNKDSSGESYLTRFSQFKNYGTDEAINDKFIDGRFGGRPKIL